MTAVTKMWSPGDEPEPMPTYQIAEDALDRARGRDHDRLFTFLYGDAADFTALLAAGRVSLSELDLGFAKLLAEWGSRDPDQIAAIMEESPRARPKWTTKRGARTWLAITIAAALRKVPDHTEVALTDAAPADAEPLDVTVAELAENPALLTGPEAVSPWLTWRGQLSMLVGREKLAGKSTLAASDAARAAKAGHTVLWIDAEQGHNRVGSRFVELGAPLERLVTLRRWPQAWADVEDVLARRQPAAIYVDSLSSFLMIVEGKVPDTSEGEKWQALVGRFKRWATAGAGVCVLLHATKADGNYRGSTGIGAAPDVILTMRDDPADPCRRWLDVRGRWGFPAQCVRFEGEATGYRTVDGATAPAASGPKISTARATILKALKPGMKWAEWKAAYGGNPNTFKHGIAWLRSERLVHYDDGTGQYQRDEFEASQVVA